MVPQFLITGSTGFLGGTTLRMLTNVFPDAKHSALVRTDEQARAISSQYPGVTTIVGDISDEKTTVLAAKEADVVINVAGDQDTGLRHILSGLAGRPDKGALIHVSGVTCLLDPSDLRLGSAARVYSDADDADEIQSLGVDRQHIAQDRLVMDGYKDLGVKTVVLSSCQIMGNGVGPWKKESYGHWYIQAVLGRGKAFMIEQGGNIWSWCSVSDVASAITWTLSKLVAGNTSLKFGKDGYYFVHTGELSFKDQSKAVATRLKKLGKLETVEVDSLTVSQAAEIHPYAGILWGASCRSRADRLRAMGWEPKETDWRLLMDEVVNATVEM